MHDHLLILSTKLVASFTGAVVSFMAQPVISAIETAPPWLAEYGAIGSMCAFLVYALKILHNINQNLQKDWREDRRKAEIERLADRDTFWGKIENLFDDAAKSREQLGEKFERLTQGIETSCKKHSDAIDSLERVVKNHTNPHNQ